MILVNKSIFNILTLTFLKILSPQINLILFQKNNPPIKLSKKFLKNFSEYK